jgi:death on curing protein
VSPEFLNLEDVLLQHEQALALWGGTDGIRDQGLLLAAIGQPQATFDGVYLYADLYEMAAVYAVHISQAQAFLDGSKRAGLMSALVFLKLNGIPLGNQHDILYLAMLDIADHKMTRQDLAALLRTLPILT